MRFSILSWNVENFNGAQPQRAAVIDHIRNLNPDVFGLFEIQKPVDVFSLIQNDFPAYDFGITDGPQNKEILVGWRRQGFSQATFTQKREFKVHNPFLRPGALVSLRHGNTNFHLLFLHTDSGTTARDFGNRFEMFEKIDKMRQGLNDMEPGNARFLVLGDLNTMGMQYPAQRRSNEIVTEPQEITALGTDVPGGGMRVLRKQHTDTFNNGRRLLSDLDHILSTPNIRFNTQGQRDGQPYQVRVVGWNQLTGNAKANFIDNISDHSALFAEVQ